MSEYLLSSKTLVASTCHLHNLNGEKISSFAGYRVYNDTVILENEDPRGVSKSVNRPDPRMCLDGKNMYVSSDDGNIHGRVNYVVGLRFADLDAKVRVLEFIEMKVDKCQRAEWVHKIEEGLIQNAQGESMKDDTMAIWVVADEED